MSRALVIAEHDDHALAASTLNTLGAARALDPDQIDVAILSGDVAPLCADAATLGGVTRVLGLARAENSPYLAAVWAPQIADLARDYSHILAPATTFGKDLLPRVAGLLNTGMLSDLIAIDGPHAFRRPIYAGNAIVRIAADPERLVCATVRPTAFDAVKREGFAAIESVSLDIELPAHTSFVESRGERDAGPDLQTASRVVAGGRGTGGPDGLALASQLAELLGAAVGASRAAVDAGWVANDLQVGQTGKIIAPELYIALGISGAIQHITGIKDAGTIVAINRDADAPICALADIVLVADLFEAVPELIARLRTRSGLV